MQEAFELGEFQLRRESRFSMKELPTTEKMDSQNAKLTVWEVTFPDGTKRECVMKRVCIHPYEDDQKSAREKQGEIVSELLVLERMRESYSKTENGLLRAVDYWGSMGRVLSVLTPKMEMDLLVFIIHYNQNNKQVESRELHTIINNVAKGLSWLHKHGIVHGDVKPENILLRRTNTSWEAYLGDYGLAYSVQRVGDSRDDHSGRCSIGYAAPELRANCFICGPSNDMWSFGLVVYLTAMAPGATMRWLNSENEWVMEEHADPEDEINLVKELQVSDKDPLLIRICARALDWNPDTRATAIEIVEVLEGRGKVQN